MSAALPLNIHSTRSVHFRALLGSGTYLVRAAVAAVVAFTIGAAGHDLAIMIGGPAVVALATVAIAWTKASRDAESEFFSRFASVHRLDLWPEWTVSEFTPLLAGGERRHCSNWMEKSGRGVGWYTYEVRHDNGNKPDTWDPVNFTIGTVDVGEQGMGRFQGIYLRRRRGLFDHLNADADWLRGHDLKRVELESTAFGQRYELLADRDQDELVLRQLFSPSFILWCAEHPLQPGFELRAGELVVYIPGHCGEAGQLEFLLMAADEISKRIRAELTEAAQAGSL